jgi:hypothetical protein
MSATYRLGFTCFACILMGVLALGQGTAQTYRGDLTVPFGEIPVRIVQLDDFLVFIDEENPQTSFVVHREDIDNLTTEADRVSLDLRNPIQDRSGHTQGLSFRVQERGLADSLYRWRQQAGQAFGDRAAQERFRDDTRRDTRREDTRLDTRDNDRQDPRRETDRFEREDRPAVFADGDRVYQARHLHFFGSCSGTLTISGDMVAYESSGTPRHSREWRLADLQDVNMHDSNFITVYPRNETHYNIELTGRGIERATFERLSDAIAAGGRAE